MARRKSTTPDMVSVFIVGMVVGCVLFGLTSLIVEDEIVSKQSLNNACKDWFGDYYVYKGVDRYSYNKHVIMCKYQKPKDKEIIRSIGVEEKR